MPAYGWTINNLVVGKLFFSSHFVGKCIKVKSVTDHGLDFKIKKKEEKKIPLISCNSQEGQV